MKELGTKSEVESPITRVWHVTRISPNGAVRETVLVHAVDPEEAREIGMTDERTGERCWTVVLCS